MTINCRGTILDLSTPVVAGILNFTPDSFYDGGRYDKKDVILKRTEEMSEAGAAMIDIGAYSSRPNADHISVDKEQKRLITVLEIVRTAFPDLIISVDTFRSTIADFVIKEFDVDIINDITAGNYDPDMFDLIADHQVPYVIMHMKGMPQNMQDDPVYDDLLKDLLKFFSEKKLKAWEVGINDLIIDPGFGFGKQLEDNYILLKHLELFNILDLPIMVGLSRKSMIYKLEGNGPEEALSGTIGLHMIALQKGAQILRVHDVKEAVQLIGVFNKLNTV
jgi:dihydropteroate synthase